MAYTPNAPAWAAGVAPGISAIRLNHLETQYQEVANLFDAHSILIAVADNTPIVLPVAASRVVGRAAAGNIVALTGAEVLTIIDRVGKSNLEWASGTVLVGAGAGSDPTEVILPTTVIKKTANEVVNNSNVFQNDDHLFFAMAANEVYDVALLCLGWSATLGDNRFKFQWVLPAGGVMSGGWVWRKTAGGADAYQGLYEEPTPAATGKSNISAGNLAANGALVLYERCIITNAGNAGNCQLQWAQNTAIAENTTLAIGSCIIAHQIV